MKVTYHDGAFSLSWTKCRAWYNADGTLADAEYKLRSGATRAVSAKHTHVRAWLEKQGKMIVKCLTIVKTCDAQQTRLAPSNRRITNRYRTWHAQQKYTSQVLRALSRQFLRGHVLREERK